MPTVSYITPITDRTNEDVAYARTHQNDLTNKNKGAWNYTDANRVCNNLKYAAERMYEQGFFNQPYSIQVKLDWKETDIITYEELNSMIVDNMNNLKTYSRSDLAWYPVASIANMDYNTANWIELNIDALAKQEPIPEDSFTLTVENGSGSGIYEANTVVTIQAYPPAEGEIFSYWSGDHLENIGSGTVSVTTYTMPYEDIRLKANYTGTMPHNLTIITNTKTETILLSMGDTYYVEADPAPFGKVFHHWDVEPSTYEDNFYEPAASTYFTMPNEDVTISAFYITTGQKQLIVQNGQGSGWYDYDTYVSVKSDKPSDGIFTNWTGDTQYLSRDATEEYNSIRIPDVSLIEITAHWTVPPVPPVTGVKLTVVNGIIASTGETEGSFTQGDQISIMANIAEEDQIFDYWTYDGQRDLPDYISTNTVVTIGTEDSTVTAVYRDLEYHKLTVITNSGTTSTTLEKYDYFNVDAEPAPDNYTFDKWTGDTDEFSPPYRTSVFYTSHVSTGTYMGSFDRTITATYRPILTHTLTIKQPSGDVTYNQDEFTTLTVTAETAVEGMRFIYWQKDGAGDILSYRSQSTIFTFGNGDTTLTPVYVNIWTITVVDGTIEGSPSLVLNEGYDYDLAVKDLEIYEKFDGWTQEGPGTIYNTAATKTKFVVGNGNTTITANISQYPDKTLTVYWRDPDTEEDTLISQETYTYGTTISNIQAKIAPNKTTFLSWLGDVSLLSPSALASTVSIEHLTADTTIIATYYYPDSPDYYTLTVYDGYPGEGQYAVGSQITVRAKSPSQGWEFYKWYGDTQYLVNPDLTLTENAVIIPQQAISLYAKFKLIGEMPLYRISVINGTASGSYEDSNGNVHNESGVYIDVPAGTQVELEAEPDIVGWVFGYWDGNFEQAGVTDITVTDPNAKFTSVESDLNIVMVRNEQGKATVYTTNATGPGAERYPGTYPIYGNLQNTDDHHYEFLYWTCVDANGTDYISRIAEPNNVSTTITVDENETFWVEAVYETYYKLTVVEGQDTGSGYYAEGSTVTSVYANTPTLESRLIFDYWNDPTNIVQNKYDPTPTIVMKNTVSTITAVFVSLDAKGNSIAITGDATHDGKITRQDSYLINGVYAVGTIVFDKDGCIGVITEIDPDGTDDTNDYKVEKLFYGGNF